MSEAISLWRGERVVYRYPGAASPAVDGATVEARSGEMVALIGPNGSGKSTLLRLLVGVRAPDRGRVVLEGRPIEAWPRVERARRIGVLPQHEAPAFPVTADELVRMGRYPHLGPWRRLDAVDRAAIERALARCRVSDLAERPFSTLSGGERQRVRIARALAQEPDALALDEPTAALDVAHEMEIWEILRAEADAGRAVLVTTHHLNQAARYADRLVLLQEGRLVAAGTPSDVLDADAVAHVYGWPVRVDRLSGEGLDAGAPQVVPLRGVPPKCRPRGPNPTHSSTDRPPPTEEPPS